MEMEKWKDSKRNNKQKKYTLEKKENGHSYQQGLKLTELEGVLELLKSDDNFCFVTSLM